MSKPFVTTQQIIELLNQLSQYTQGHIVGRNCVHLNCSYSDMSVVQVEDFKVLRLHIHLCRCVDATIEELYSIYEIKYSDWGGCICRQAEIGCVKCMSNFKKIRHEGLTKILITRHKNYKLAQGFLKLPPAMQAQILSAMKPNQVAIFSLINRKWNEFCRSYQMAPYWERQLLMPKASNSIYNLDLNNWYRAYQKYAYERYMLIPQIYESLKGLDQIVGVANRTAYINHLLSLLSPQLVKSNSSMNLTLRRKLYSFYHTDNWPGANIHHQRLFGYSIGADLLVID